MKVACRSANFFTEVVIRVNNRKVRRLITAHGKNAPLPRFLRACQARGVAGKRDTTRAPTHPRGGRKTIALPPQDHPHADLTEPGP